MIKGNDFDEKKSRNAVVFQLFVRLPEIDSLKEKERAIIVLRDIEELSYKEIAEVFGCSLGRVKSRIHEARQKLKAILETETDLWND